MISIGFQSGCLSLALLLISWFSISAQGVDSGKHATVAELEHLLSKFGYRADRPIAASSGIAPDPGVKARDDQMQALEIDFIKLTERLTPWTRERLEKTYRLGPQGFDALERIADLSALLPPPASDIATDPAPDPVGQKRIFSLALTAGLDGLRNLPPYSVKSITEYYNNGYCVTTDQQMVSDMIYNYKHKWQGIGPWTSTFSVEDGKESEDRNEHFSEPGRLPKPPNFESWGEFSAQPALTLGDISIENKFRFIRWEKSPGQLLAVFLYEVSAANSHYRVDASCGKNLPFQSTPAYQGTISIDPHTGAILRLTMQAASQKKDPVFNVAVAIDYGPVKLGEAQAFLPQRSLTFMTEDPNVCLGTQQGIDSAAGGRFMIDYLPTRRYNRVTFTDFHSLTLDPSDPEASDPQ